MKNITLSALIFFASVSIYGQNLIGYSGKEIQKFMLDNRQNMNSEKVENERFNYLKYSDNEDSQTLLFFLNQDSICKSVKMICDLSVKADKEKEFNMIYKANGENQWIDKRDGKDYFVMLKIEKWSCVITIEPEK